MNPDLCLILHGPWGLLIDSACGAITAVTPAIVAGAMKHEYLFCQQGQNRSPIAAGVYRIQATGGGRGLTLADPKQTRGLKVGCSSSDLAYLTLQLPGGAVCYYAGGYEVNFQGSDAEKLEGGNFPHTLLLYYPSAAAGANLNPPVNGLKQPTLPADGSAAILHFYGQHHGSGPSPRPSHFACLARSCGLDLEFVAESNPAPVPNPPLPASCAGADLNDLAPMRNDLPFTCGGGLVIFG